MISSKEIAKELFANIESGKSSVAFFDAFISYMEKKGMAHLLPSILSHLEYRNKLQKQFSTLKIKFGKEPTEKTIDSVKKFIKTEEKEVPVESLVDESIIGGFIAEYRGIVYDGSVRGYLRTLKSKLKEI